MLYVQTWRRHKHTNLLSHFGACTFFVEKKNILYVESCKSKKYLITFILLVYFFLN